MEYIMWVGIAAVVVVGGLTFFITRKLGSALDASGTNVLQRSPDALAVQDAAIAPIKAAPNLPYAIVLGQDFQRPGVRITPLSDAERYREGKALSADSGLGGSLSAGLQAVPALLVAEGHRGKQLMEVVINGDLVRAKDGVGLRAWTVGADNKISEHAKLFDTNNLTNVVNAAALWQVASVVVAQKHLADISAKLDDIRMGVQDVAHFLDEERRAKVTGTYEYLTLVASAIANGELPPASRIQLESGDRELIQIQHHLQQELERRCGEPVKHTEFAGTADFEKELVDKYGKLKNLSKDMHLTLKTRALAWHVLSLYPGEPGLKQAKMEGLRHSAEEVEARLKAIEASAEHDCKNITSFWNKQSTLDIRKTNVREAAQDLASDLRKGVSQAKDDLQMSHTLLLTHDQPTYLCFEVEDGRIGALKVLEPFPVSR